MRTMQATASPETIAKQKAKLRDDDVKAKAVESQRQREAQERAERAQEVSDELAGNFAFTGIITDGDVVTFQYRGHKFEIREVE